jgi:hypothetical protein
MYPLHRYLFSFLLVTALPGCWHAHATGPVSLKASAAMAIITPPPGTPMVEPQGAKATGVHDDLYLRILLLSDGTRTLLLASYDLIGMDLSLSDRIRQAVSDETGLPAGNIMLSCTHTHNAPVTVNLGGDESRRNRPWEEQLKNTTVRTAVKAAHHLKPATLSVGTQAVQIGLNRRLMMFNRARMQPNPYGPVARETQAIRIDFGPDSSAVLFSYPAHPVAVLAGSARFTADFPGFAVQAIRNELGSTVMPVFVQGCAGDVNVNPTQGGFEAADRVGKALGSAVVSAFRGAHRLPPGKIYARSEKLLLPYQSIAPEVAGKIVLRVEEGMRALQESHTDSINLMDQRDLLHWARIVRQVADNPGANPGLPFEMQIFSFGKDLAVIAFTHELFVEYQLYLQARSPFRNTIVLAYTNGSASYIPTADAFYLNGYEVHGAQHRYGRPYLTPECEALIKKSAIRELNRLYRKY